MSSIYTKDLLRPWIEARGFEIGDHSYGAPTIHSWQYETNRLIIGRYCSIGGAVNVLMGGNHHVEWVTTYPFGGLSHVWPEAAGRTDHPVTRGDIRIGSDVWIGQHATILSGVVIGDGAVIGTESVVARDVPPYAIVAGNPARVLRSRFPAEIIARLLRMRWWEWPDEKVHQAVPLMLSGDIERFLATYETAPGQDEVVP